jgi:hypothetical protein
MLRVLCFFLITVFYGASPALSQEAVSLRTGQHEDYSRLVFDWAQRAEYSVSRPDSGRLQIIFENDGLMNPEDVAGLSERNIADVKIESQSPLTISLRIPEGSDIRDFYAGNRLVVDIYNDPAGKTVGSSQPKPEKTTAAAPEPKAEPKAEPAPPPAPPPPEAAAADDEETVLEDTAADPEPKAVPVQAKAPALKIGNNLVTISSTTTMNFAVFRRGDEVWFVNDRPDLVLSPQISGPNAEMILPVRSLKLESGTAYKARNVPGSHIKVQGGGLVWRTVISDQPDSDPPTVPMRQDVKEPERQGRKIVWPFKGKTNLVSAQDPLTGGPIMIVTVEDGEQFSGPAMEFVDFETFYAPAGLVILPKVDDLEVTLTKDGVEVFRPSGLNILAQDMIDRAQATKAQKKSSGSSPDTSSQSYVFNFESWSMGDSRSVDDNKNIILSSMAGQEQSQKVQSMITLAKMYLAHAQWAETQGVLAVAAQELPDLERNPEFMALTGAAKALSYDSEGAFELLSNDTLKPYEEINYWRAFTLADLGDWQQAAQVLPKSSKTLGRYTDPLINRLGLVLAEVALRDGKVDAGNEILAMVAENTNTMLPEQKAALQYLQGEAARQKGDTKKTMELWEPLTKGKDDLYRAKTGLALTRLLANEKKIDNKKAIDQLERLRYAWRGDELEAQINYWLGKTYLDDKEFVKGLGILREAATFSAGTVLGSRITSEMTEIFTNLFLGEDLKGLSPLDAATLNEQFSELLPTGDRGNKVIEKLAEHLVKADLLGRAAELLQRQVDHRLKGEDAYRIAVRLTEIYLLDENAARASPSLKKAKALLSQLPVEAQTPARKQDLQLLEARTLSQLGRSDRALEMLNDMALTPAVNLLRADIAWKAQYWDDASEALNDVILDKDISLTRPLSPENALLILQRAVALNLASDRIGLANLRERYSDSMAQTEKARIFEVITRPRQSAALADRETLMSIVSEVDLFSDFLKTYKGAEPEATPSAPEAAATPPVAAPSGEPAQAPPVN